jgi:ABC-type transporter Mla maintaining outer membrane lipid asymmetry ATPase subunit MlaF
VFCCEVQGVCNVIGGSGCGAAVLLALLQHL